MLDGQNASKESKGTFSLASILDVASYIILKYKEITSEHMDEMRLHKLLYFAQRESFAILGQPMFKGDFSGWKYGPVSHDIRNSFYNGELVVDTQDICDTFKHICNNIILIYGVYSSWKLSELSHGEQSWLNSRKDLKDGENGDRPIALADIKMDSKKVVPYDPLWGMDYDEFETVDKPC